MAEVATGGGKTIFALACYQSLQDDRADLGLGVIVPTNALLDQWYVALVEELGALPRDIAVYNGDSHPTKPARFTLCTINTARTDKGPMWLEPTMLVVDECHRVGSPRNAQALHGTFHAALGLSATPRRQYDDGFTQYVEPVLGHVFYEYSLADAESDGILSPFTLENVRVPLLADEAAEYERLTKAIARFASQGSDAPPELLRARARVAQSAAMRVPVAAAIAIRSSPIQTIIFHESISEANRILGLVHRGRGSATAYHSRIAPEMRRENLSMFRRGTFTTLVTCRALDEGINVPEVGVAVIAAGTASDRQRVQRLGRVLRPAKGKSMARVVTIYATDREERRLATEAAALEGLATVRWLNVEEGNAPSIG